MVVVRVGLSVCVCVGGLGWGRGQICASPGVGMLRIHLLKQIQEPAGWQLTAGPGRSLAPPPWEALRPAAALTSPPPPPPPPPGLQATQAPLDRQRSALSYHGYDRAGPHCFLLPQLAVHLRLYRPPALGAPQLQPGRIVSKDVPPYFAARNAVSEGGACSPGRLARVHCVLYWLCKGSLRWHSLSWGGAHLQPIPLGECTTCSSVAKRPTTAARALPGCPGVDDRPIPLGRQQLRHLARLGILHHHRRVHVRQGRAVVVSSMPRALPRQRCAEQRGALGRG